MYPKRVRKNRLAARVRAIIFGLLVLSVLLLLLVGNYIFNAISDDFARRLSRQYSIEAAANFLASTNAHFVLAQQLAYSTTISRWVAHIDDTDIMAIALDEIEGYASFAPYISLRISFYDSFHTYYLSTGFTTAEFDYDRSMLGEGPAREWFLDTRDAELPFNLNIQRSRGRDEHYNIYVWTNHRIYYEDRFVGVMTAGSLFSDVFDAMFGGFDADIQRGYIIDDIGRVRADSAGLLQVFDAGWSMPAPVPEAADNPEMAQTFVAHLQRMQDGAFRFDTEVSDAITIQGNYRYASIAPIIGTNWSVAVLSGNTGVLGEQYVLMAAVVLIIVIVFVLIGNHLIQKVVITPLHNLTLSTASIGVTENTELFGLERDDEIGDLAQTIKQSQEQRDMLSKLKAEIEKTEEANRAKTKFLSNMSHEIRTPMNSVLGIAELQLRKDTHPPETEEAFMRIYNSSNLLLSIINDILDLSKVEAGKMEIISAAYETANIIVDTVQLNIMYIGSKNIELEVSVDERLPVYLIGDEFRIKQILNNLLSNAFKYTVSGTVKLSFSIQDNTEDNTEGNTEDNDPVLVITVSDTGQGMTEEQINNLFENEFTRFNLPDNRAIEGSGLGMVISYRLIHMMGGDIFVESTLGKGSAFTVLLPQKKLDEAVLGPEAAARLQDLEYIRKSMKEINKIEREPMPYGRVLVVDDVESNLYVAKGSLMPYKLAVDIVTGGEPAIEKIKDGQVYDIIFMDHMMPGIDGIEATNIIRAMGYKHPIVALTANAVSGASELFMKNGFDAFITKPIDLNQLDKCLMRFIRDKQPPKVIKRESE